MIRIKTDAKKVTMPITIPVIAIPRPLYFAGLLSTFCKAMKPTIAAGNPSKTPPPGQQTSRIERIPSASEMVGRV